MSTHTAIRIDPATGFKTFDTRAEAADQIVGKGYDVVEGEAATTLPAQPAGAVFNAEEQAKYREFREARRGAADYMAMEGELQPLPRGRLLAPAGRRGRRSPTSARSWWSAPASPACSSGTGCAQAGFDDVRFCEKGGDVGGTWYWNRYPGIACDVESYSYLPLLEEMEYFPTMKFASGFEIFEYCQKMAEKFDFYDHCLFHTTVDRTVWDEETGRWTVYTDRGDEMKARFVVLANGDPHHAEAGSDPRHGDLPGRVVPYVTLELPRRAARQAGRHHRHRRHRRPGHPRAGQGRRRAVRVPAHPLHASTCATSGRRPPRRSRSGRTSPAGPGPAEPASPS